MTNRPKTSRELLTEISTPEELAKRAERQAKRDAIDAKIEAELCEAASIRSTLGTSMDVPRTHIRALNMIGGQGA